MPVVMRDDGNGQVHPDFEDAALQLLWARDKLSHLQQAAQDYEKNGIKIDLEEPSEDEPNYRVIYRTGNFLPVPLIVGDVVRNLHAALDYSVSAIFRKNGRNDRGAYFPAREDQNQLERRLECHEMRKGLGEIQPLFISDLGATKNRHPSVYHLHLADRMVKHRNLNVITQFIVTLLPDFIAGDLTFHTNVQELVPGDEHCFSLPKHAVITREPQASGSLQIRFGPDEAFAQQDVIPTLHVVANDVGRLVKGMHEAYKGMLP